MLAIETRQEHPTEDSYALEFQSGERQVRGQGPPAFTLSLTDEEQFRRILNGDDYAVALAFIQGKFDVQGDLAAALRFKRRHSRKRFPKFLRLAGHWVPARLESWFQTRRRAAENIRFHYDVSNEFYQNFLDSRMVYSAACFEDPDWTLEQAQAARLNQICEHLDLRPGDRFLDVGCGWGGLLTHAAAYYKVYAVGCTLSHKQFEYVSKLIGRRGLEKRATVVESDYRNLSQRFNKIASIGMFEHVGKHRLGNYFRKMHDLLEPGGLFLNSGVTRPENVADDAETLFLLRKVFPGGELARLVEVVREVELAGFHLLKMESLREHYARTCRSWVERLQQTRLSSLRLVGQETYRTWLLYLAASAISFETGRTDVFSVLTSKYAS